MGKVKHYRGKEGGRRQFAMWGVSRVQLEQKQGQIYTYMLRDFFSNKKLPYAIMGAG